MLFFIQLLLFIQVAFGLPTIPTDPKDDPFYLEPEGFEDAPVGAILNYRNAPAAIRSVVFEVNIRNTWQLLVRSTDSHGNPSVIVTTVFEPYNADSSKLLSYQVAQDSASLSCAPSYAFLNGDIVENVSAEAEMFLIQTALNEGYYVVSPDYEGLKSVFTGGIQASHGVLDSLRATLNSQNITGINPDADTVLWGYSGGSLASGWAAAMQPTYAPDLAPNLKGVAVGGWVTNITATITSVSGGLFAGLGPNGMAGLSNEYPELATFLEGAMYEDKYQKFLKAHDLCLLPSIAEFLFNDFFEGDDRYFIDGVSVLNESPVAEIIEANTLGLNNSIMPQIPVFVYHGNIDTIVPFDQAVRVYDVWCDAGIESLEFAVDLTAGHVSEVIQGSGAAFAWVQKIFNGEKPVLGCQRTERLTNLLYPGSSASIFNLLTALFRNIAGINIGDNGENLTIQNNRLVSNDNVTTTA